MLNGKAEQPVNLCLSWGHERLRKFIDTLKTGFENENIAKCILKKNPSIGKGTISKSYMDKHALFILLIISPRSLYLTLIYPVLDTIYADLDAFIPIDYMYQTRFQD